MVAVEDRERKDRQERKMGPLGVVRVNNMVESSKPFFDLFFAREMRGVFAIVHEQQRTYHLNHLNNCFR
jgi:hypothetical protein